MTVPQAVEKFSVFNHAKKCFLCSVDFRRKTGIFCAAVVNGKASWPFENRTAVTKEERPPAAQELRRNRQRLGQRGLSANDNFLITVPSLDSFSLLVTVLFVVERG